MRFVLESVTFLGGTVFVCMTI